MTVDAMAVDALVIRHNASGACHQVAQWVRCSVINAGTARTSTRRRPCSTHTPSARRLGDLDGKHVVIVGDLTHSPGLPQQRHHPQDARCARHGRRPTHPDAQWHRGVERSRRVRDELGPRPRPRRRRRARSRRRRHDAPRPARTDERRLLPDGPRVHRRLRPDPRPARAARRPQRRRARAPPGPDEPRPRDRARGGRLAAVRRPRPGLRRCRGPDGRALPPARGRRHAPGRRRSRPATEGAVR